MPLTIKTDVLIIGAGIAGLWLLNRLQQAGFSALLLEQNAIGSGQTIASQGIIHGGTKYALTGSMAQTGQAVADMPKRWQDCIQGIGEIDLTGVKILSDHQYLWSTDSLTSRLAAFFGSKTLRGRVHALKKQQFPLVFQNEKFKGQVYQLQEFVIDVPSVLQKLTANYHSVILHTRHIDIDFDTNHFAKQCMVELTDGKKLQIEAQRYILTAGKGNETLLGNTASLVPMQKRPLQMAIVKHLYDIPLYAHCMIANPKPRVTITTHYTQDQKTVWYIGGLLAENGVNQTEQELVAATRAELNELFPGLDFNDAQISGYRVDRAEPAQSTGHLPGDTYAQAINNIIVGWPTKLAMAPKLAADIIEQLTKQGITPTYHLESFATENFPVPPIATAIWER